MNVKMGSSSPIFGVKIPKKFQKTPPSLTTTVDLHSYLKGNIPYTEHLGYKETI